jgi:hypothetical protein
MGNAQPDGLGKPGVSGSGKHLEELLGRAQNAFELDETVLTHLKTAGLMWHTQLHSFRQRKGPPRRLTRRTLKHVCLLADGSGQVLWEVAHNTGPDEVPVYEVYGDWEALTDAQRVIDWRFGEPTPEELESQEPTQEELEAETRAFLADLPGLLAMEPVKSAKEYTWDHSVDHALRVLRRAENKDAPGPELRLLLMAAVAHDITNVTGRHSYVGVRVAGWTLYEHAFLLADGSEVSVWEIEHTMAPDGLPVCEVYTGKRAACDAADTRLLRLEAL